MINPWQLEQAVAARNEDLRRAADARRLRRRAAPAGRRLTWRTGDLLVRIGERLRGPEAPPALDLRISPGGGGPAC
jgi:hypothetical protein